MWIGMFVFFYFESTVFLFQLYADIHIHIHVHGIVPVIFYKSSAEFINPVYKFAFLINKCKDPESVFLTDFKIIRSKSRRRMNDAGSFFRSNKISRNDSEWICIRRDAADFIQTARFAGY